MDFREAPGGRSALFRSRVLWAEWVPELGALPVLDVHFSTTGGREWIFTRYSRPEPGHQMFLAQLDWELLTQPPPRISGQRHGEM